MNPNEARERLARIYADPHDPYFSPPPARYLGQEVPTEARQRWEDRQREVADLERLAGTAHDRLPGVTATGNPRCVGGWSSWRPSDYDPAGFITEPEAARAQLGAINADPRHPYWDENHAEHSVWVAALTRLHELAAK